MKANASFPMLDNFDAADKFTEVSPFLINASAPMVTRLEGKVTEVSPVHLLNAAGSMLSNPCQISVI